MAYPGYPTQQNPNLPYPNSMPPYPAQGGGLPGVPPPLPPAGYGYNPQMQYPPQGVGPYPGYPMTSAPAGYPPVAHGYGPPSQPHYPPTAHGAHGGYIPPSPQTAPIFNSSASGGYNQHGQQSFTIKQYTPTIRPKVPYGIAEETTDATALRKAMKGLGTDEKAIIALVANRTNHERQLIKKRFNALYGKDLEKELKSELSGKFRDVVLTCMTPLDQYYATELHDAMTGVGTNESTLIEILCSLNNGWIHATKNAYQQLYKKTLESDIKADTSGYFERLLVSLSQGMRDESPHPNPALVTGDVQELFEAGQKRKGTDETTFSVILSNRSLSHLREVFKQYHSTHGVPFEKVIKSEFSGSVEAGMLAVVRCMNDCANFYAEKLHDSMAGVGTKDRVLIRIIVSRAECDLGDIKVAFQQKYGKSLESCIEKDCSGDYKKMLIAMVTAN